MSQMTLLYVIFLSYNWVPCGHRKTVLDHSWKGIQPDTFLSFEMMAFALHIFHMAPLVNNSHVVFLSNLIVAVAYLIHLGDLLESRSLLLFS